MIELIVDRNFPVLLKLSELIGNRFANAISCTVKAGVVVTIIDDYAPGFDSMQILIKAERDAKVVYLQEGSVGKISIDMILAGDRAEIIFRAVGQLEGQQSLELTTCQMHNAAYTHSKSTVRIVHADSSRSHYQGAIVIENSAKYSQAFQDHKALLLSPDARAYARPTLEAKTHELQCGHGSAIGFLDPEQLWYLQSRGIGNKDAEKLLVKAFLCEK